MPKKSSQLQQSALSKQSRATLKNWFRTGLKPLQNQFWSVFDSYWHKDDVIPQGAIENLETEINDIRDRIQGGGLVVAGEYNSDAEAQDGGVGLNDYYAAGQNHRDGVRWGTPIRRNY